MDWLIVEVRGRSIEGGLELTTFWLNILALKCERVERHGDVTSQCVSGAAHESTTEENVDKHMNSTRIINTE